MKFFLMKIEKKLFFISSSHEVLHDEEIKKKFFISSSYEVLLDEEIEKKFIHPQRNTDNRDGGHKSFSINIKEIMFEQNLRKLVQFV